jgi:hypothetical protein
MLCGFRRVPWLNTMQGFVYASYDYGRAWHESLVEASSRFVTEESCTVGPNNRAYFAAGVSNTDDGLARHPFGHMYLYGSDDLGRTWRKPVTGPFLDYTSRLSIGMAQIVDACMFTRMSRSTVMAIGWKAGHHCLLPLTAVVR